MSTHVEKWDVQYEWKAITLLTLSFGLVGLDRFIILPLFPVMMKDLHLDYQDLGNITAVLAITWGISSVFMGRAADKLGLRKVLLPAIVLFSFMAGISGFSVGILSLLIIRAAMGFSEGAFLPTCITATTHASKPVRRGFNLGLQQIGLPIMGLGIGPIIATQLLGILPSWRWVFLLVSLPGFILAWLMYRVIRESRGGEQQRTDVSIAAAVPAWWEIFRYRNIVLNVLSMFCMVTCLNVAAAMTPNYLTDYLHLNMQQMGFVASALGFGALAGGIVLPGLSDIIGRKTVVILCYLGATVSIWVLMQTGANPARLFASLFGVSMFCFSMVFITVGPLTTESVPSSMTAEAVGIVGGVSEIFGAGIVPPFAGFIAKHYGIQHVYPLSLGSAILGLIIAFGIKETRTPSLTLKRRVKAA
jgi:MFS family permease